MKNKANNIIETEEATEQILSVTDLIKNENNKIAQFIEVVVSLP